MSLNTPHRQIQLVRSHLLAVRCSKHGSRRQDSKCDVQMHAVSRIEIPQVRHEHLGKHARYNGGPVRAKLLALHQDML